MTLLKYRALAGGALLTSVLFAASCARNDATAAGPATAGDTAALIAEALSAAPPAIASIATVMNWDGSVLKAGSEEWVCYPSMPDREGVCPMCLDKPWQAWLGAFASGQEPPSGTLGVSYMLRGDCAVSNIDPMAMKKTADNDWVHEGPHIMLLSPDRASLTGMTRDHHSGGPYVMWGDTPYAHIMVPLPASE